jgi:hypothetical protein
MASVLTAALGAAACAGGDSAGFADAAHDTSTLDAPADVLMGDLGLVPATTPTRDSGDTKDARDESEAGPLLCQPPKDVQDGSIIPPPRPCDAGMPPPPPPH